MCQDESYTYLAPLSFGGKDGQYILTPQVTSYRWAEYCVLALGIGNNTANGWAYISGTEPLPPTFTLPLDQTYQINTDTPLPGFLYLFNKNNCPSITPYWTRIVDQRGRVFINVFGNSSQSIYVTIGYRLKPMRQVLGRTTTVHEDLEEQLNIAREHAIVERLESGSYNKPTTPPVIEKVRR